MRKTFGCLATAIAIIAMAVCCSKPEDAVKPGQEEQQGGKDDTGGKDEEGQGEGGGQEQGGKQLKKDGQYLIGSLDELKAWVEDRQNWLPEDTVLLTADIDMMSEPWTSVEGFTGTFDGQGHCIYNFVSSPYQTYYCFFGDCSPVEIKNVYFGTKDGRTYDGVSRIEFTSSGTAYGAPIGKGAGDITNVTNFIPVTIAEGDTGTGYIGGIVATVTGDVTVVDCANYGDIRCESTTSTNNRLGGIIGNNNAAGRLSNCICKCGISTKTNKDGSYVGGLIGYQKDVALVTGEGCSVDCDIKAEYKASSSSTANGYKSAGMVIGRFSGSTKAVQFGGKFAPVDIKGSHCGVAITAGNATQYITGNGSGNVYTNKTVNHFFYISFGGALIDPGVSPGELAYDNMGGDGGAKLGSLDGRTAIFIGNSMLYYGGLVENGKQGETDAGLFYKVCRAAGDNVTVYDFTYGNHSLSDFAGPEGCSDNHNSTGCDPRAFDHLSGIDFSKVDLVFVSEAGENNGRIVADVEALFKRVKDANPSASCFYINHAYSVYKSHANILNNLKTLHNGSYAATIVNAGQLVCDIYGGKLEVKGAGIAYTKDTFINHTSSDTHHPNPLTGYIMAQMCYAAASGRTAVGAGYDFVASSNYGAGAKANGFSAYIDKYYTSGETNFDKVFGSEADMKAIQAYMDQYVNRY